MAKLLSGYYETGTRLVPSFYETVSVAPSGFQVAWTLNSNKLIGYNMKKNVASQTIGAQMITASDGSVFTGSVTAIVTIDGGTQGGGGAAVSEGNGYHSYAITQAETNGDHIAVTFTGSGAIASTVETYTTFPQTVDNDTKISLISTVVPDAAGVAATPVEVATALTDIGLDHLVSASVTGTDVTDDSIFAKIVSKSDTADWDTYDNNVDSLEALEAHINNIASTGAAFHVASNGSYVLTTGTQSANTEADTSSRNGVAHEHTSVGAAIDLYYQFDVGANGQAVEIEFHALMNGANDTIDVQIYDWIGAAWETVGTIQGSNNATAYTTEIEALFGKHTGTGGSAGLVRARFIQASGLTTATLKVDQIFIAYAESVVAYLGDGTVLTESGGTGDQLTAIATQASVNTIDTNVDAILVDTGTTLPARFDGVEGATFSTSTDSLEAIRDRGDTAWTTGAGGSSPTVGQIADAVWDEVQSGHVTAGTFGLYLDSEVSGAGGGAAPTVSQIRVEMDSNSTQLAAIVADTNELQTDDVPTLIASLDAVVDTVKVDTASILVDTTEIGVAGAGLTNIGTIANVTDVTNQVTADVTGIGGSATAATNLSASALGIETGAATGATLTTTTMSTNLPETTDDHYIGRIIVWTSGVLANQATDITDYTGATKLLTFTATTEAPSNTDTFVII